MRYSRVVTISYTFEMRLESDGQDGIVTFISFSMVLITLILDY